MWALGDNFQQIIIELSFCIIYFGFRNISELNEVRHRPAADVWQTTRPEVKSTR